VAGWQRAGWQRLDCPLRPHCFICCIADEINGTKTIGIVLRGMTKLMPYQSAATAANALMDAIRATGDVSAAFWRDPFVLGFLFYYIHALAVRAGEKPGDYGNMPFSYIELCGQQEGVEVMKHTMAFALKKDHAFREGLKAANKFVDVMYGSAAYETDPDVIDARKQAIDTKMRLQKDVEIDLSEVQNAYLLETIFLRNVRRRLGKPVQ
jgi:hypothetical protein